MSVLVGVVAGVVIGASAWRLLAGVFAHDLLGRTNVRGASVPTAGGLVLVVAALGADALLSVVVAAGWSDAPADVELGVRTTTVVAIGMGFLGLLDDVVGAGESFGFRGHLRALARGRLSSGGLKLLGGAALGVVVATAARTAPTGESAIARLLVDGAVIALAANLANLFDRAPGRLGKLGLVLGGALVVAVGAPALLAGPAVVLGATLAVLAPDLRERVMLGDTGANVLGGVLGLAVVLGTSAGVRIGVLVVLVALNLASERVSFSRVIRGTRPLRWADDLGRLPAPDAAPGPG